MKEAEEQPSATWWRAPARQWTLLLRDREEHVFLALTLLIGALVGMTVAKNPSTSCAQLPDDSNLADSLEVRSADINNRSPRTPFVANVPVAEQPSRIGCYTPDDPSSPVTSNLGVVRRFSDQFGDRVGL